MYGRDAWAILRFDDRQENYATYGTWVFVTAFLSESAALDFVRRAASVTQHLKIEKQNTYTDRQRIGA